MEYYYYYLAFSTFIGAICAVIFHKENYIIDIYSPKMLLYAFVVGFVLSPYMAFCIVKETIKSK